MDRKLDAEPTRHALDWYEREEYDERGEPLVTVLKEREPHNRLDKLLFKVFNTPRKRELDLDPIGSVIWRHCDGNHSVAELADLIESRFPTDRIEPVEETLTYFLSQLSELDLIQFSR